MTGSDVRVPTEPPLVSIVCITYNQAQFVEATVRSLCAQTWPNIEVLVADDGSTDETPQILSRLAVELGPILKVIAGKENVGIAGNTNRALLRARGELVAFCGGDDLYLPTKIERQVEWFSRNTQATLCAHDVEYFDGLSGRTTGHHFAFGRPNGGCGILQLLRNGNVFHAISVVVRRTAIPPYGVDERVPIANDYKLWLDCLSNNRSYGFLDECLARYRVNVSNVTRLSSDRIWREGFISLGLVEAEHPEHSGDCRRGRARLFLQKSLSVLREDPLMARACLMTGLAHSIDFTYSWPFWLATTFFPSSLRRFVLQRLSGT